jgi:hypothetical protein
MDTAHIKAEGSNRLLNLVDFKWLMAGMGWWVDLSRLQCDKAYIDDFLERALSSDSELLRKRSVEMLGMWSGSDAHCDATMPSTFIGFVHVMGAEESHPFGILSHRSTSV